MCITPWVHHWVRPPQCVEVGLFQSEQLGLETRVWKQSESRFFFVLEPKWDHRCSSISKDRRFRPSEEITIRFDCLHNHYNYLNAVREQEAGQPERPTLGNNSSSSPDGVGVTLHPLAHLWLSEWKYLGAANLNIPLLRDEKEKPLKFVSPGAMISIHVKSHRLLSRGSEFILGSCQASYPADTSTPEPQSHPTWIRPHHGYEWRSGTSKSNLRFNHTHRQMGRLVNFSWTGFFVHLFHTRWHHFAPQENFHVFWVFFAHRLPHKSVYTAMLFLLEWRAT